MTTLLLATSTSDPEKAPIVIWILFLIVGVTFIVTGIPVARRRVPPNGWYGIRTQATFADRDVWYDSNAQAGRHFIAMGVAFIALLAALRFASRLDDVTQIEILGGALVVVSLVDAIYLTMAASRRLKSKQAPVPVAAVRSGLTAKDIIAIEAISAGVGIVLYFTVGPDGHRVRAAVISMLVFSSLGIAYAVWRMRKASRSY